MDLLVPLLIIFIVLCVGIYTINFGRWVWSQNNKFGAIGLWLIALLQTALPLYLVFIH